MIYLRSPGQTRANFNAQAFFFFCDPGEMAGPIALLALVAVGACALAANAAVVVVPGVSVGAQGALACCCSREGCARKCLFAMCVEGFAILYPSLSSSRVAASISPTWSSPPARTTLAGSRCRAGSTPPPPTPPPRMAGQSLPRSCPWHNNSCDAARCPDPPKHDGWAGGICRMYWSLGFPFVAAAFRTECAGGQG